MSSNSWGPSTAWGGVSTVTVSSLSSWGTTQTHPPLPKLSNTPTSIPLSFGSSAQTIVQVGSSSWDVGPRSTSSHTVYSPYVASGSVESKSSSSCFATAGPVSPSLNPCLQLNSPSRLAVDFSIPPSELHHPSMGASAFSPNMTSARIIINGPTTWFFELPHSPYPLTVVSVLSQIYYFLQQIESPNLDALSSRMRSDGNVNVHPGAYRDQNLQRGGYGVGVRRIDLLGSRCCLKGFEPAPERKAWILHFRSK